MDVVVLAFNPSKQGQRQVNLSSSPAWSTESFPGVTQRDAVSMPPPSEQE